MLTRLSTPAEWRPVANAPEDARRKPDGDLPPTPDHASRLKTGGRFVLDDPAELVALWGADDQVLWPSGEPLQIVGPSGVGKTTIAAQVVAGRLGIMHELLGWPILADERPVLYLALDRPRQIRRAMRRLFGEHHREALNDRLRVWEGPLPFDLGKAPGTLLELVQQADAGTVVIDSLKDAAVKLSDDEAGGNLNRAIQLVIADGREVLALHHQRKGQGGSRPNTLEDVFGSTWITAGAGSVILLWGAAGDPLVDLVHLKQPAAEVGPLKVEHDHLAGITTIYRGVADAFAVLAQRPNGMTAVDLARLMFESEQPNDNQRKKAQRALERLVRDHQAHRVDGTRAGGGEFSAARYYLVEQRSEGRAE